VPGANDGASGVAVLLELARVLPKNIDKRVWLVFFDAEDNGSINGYDWIMGSQRYAEKLSTYPDQVVIVDMVGAVLSSAVLEFGSEKDFVFCVETEFDFGEARKPLSTYFLLLPDNASLELILKKLNLIK